MVTGPTDAEFWYYDPNPYTFFGYLGITAALVFGNLGAAYGTARSGVSICEVSSKRIDLMFKSIIPVVMAGILGIYGLIVAVLFNTEIKKTTKEQMDAGNNQYSIAKGYKQLAGGVCCGLSSLASGLAIGVIGETAVKGNMYRDLVVGMILMLIFAEALGLFGFIIAIVVNLGS